MNIVASFKSLFQRPSLEESSEKFFLGRQWKSMQQIEKLGIILIALSPTLYLGVKHWITNVSILAVLVVGYHLVQVRNKLNFKKIPYIKAITLVFVIYTAAIIISQMGRFTFTYKPYLDQSRWLIGLPIFIFLYYVRINFTKVLDWVAPVCILAAFVGSVYLNRSDSWGDRVTVSHIDPLAFGFISLSLALMCFSSLAVDIYKGNLTINTMVKFLAFVIGVYISIRTGSRTGWAAFPVVILLVLYILYRPKLLQAIIFFVSLSLGMILLYETSAIIKSRVDLVALELLNYPWLGGMAPDTSVGIRITFARLGYYYFSQSPLFGWGERGYGEIKDAAELLVFSSQLARDFAYSALFHNEWITQSVRFGIIGLLGVCWVFWLPIKLFAKFIKLGDDYLKTGCMGLSYMICLLVSSLTDEVFNSKSMITFAAIVIAGLLATGLSLKGRKQEGT